MEMYYKFSVFCISHNSTKIIGDLHKIINFLSCHERTLQKQHPKGRKDSWFPNMTANLHQHCTHSHVPLFSYFLFCHRITTPSHWIGCQARWYLRCLLGSTILFPFCWFYYGTYVLVYVAVYFSTFNPLSPVHGLFSL